MRKYFAQANKKGQGNKAILFLGATWKENHAVITNSYPH
jgi:hypothetical protein